MSLALLFHYLMLNMFRMLIHPSSGACDLFVELLHGLYGSGSAGVVWYPDAGWSTSASACIRSNTTHEITQQISRKLLRMDVLTSETCWALNNEIIKQVTSSWSLFIQLFSRFFTCPICSLFYLCIFGHVLDLVDLTMSGWSSLSCLVAVTYLNSISTRFPLLLIFPFLVSKIRSCSFYFLDYFNSFFYRCPTSSEGF